VAAFMACGGGGPGSAWLISPPAGLNNACSKWRERFIRAMAGSGLVSADAGWYGSYCERHVDVIASTHTPDGFIPHRSGQWQCVCRGPAGMGRQTHTGRRVCTIACIHTWRDIAQPASNLVYSDEVSKMLPNGRAAPGEHGAQAFGIYTPVLNPLSAAAASATQFRMSLWVRLPNDTSSHWTPSALQVEHMFLRRIRGSRWRASQSVCLLRLWRRVGEGFVLPKRGMFLHWRVRRTRHSTARQSPCAGGTWCGRPEWFCWHE